MILEIIQITILVSILIVLLIKNKPTKESKVSKKQHTIVLDSCALIDGRIIELAKAGFITAKLEVPEFILAELQLLADGNDSQKRERARFGLEVVQILQAEPTIEIDINHLKIEADNTDDKLVVLAKRIGADLFTTDFNLNQVASIKGVRVLNVNELAHSLRPTALPGEDITIKVIQTGSNKDQGVGYLEDGTMVVIDNARQDIGREIKIKVTRTHQTVAGKMLFAKKIGVNKTVNIINKGIKKSVNKIPRISNTKSQNYSQRMTKQEESLFKAIDESNKN